MTRTVIANILRRLMSAFDLGHIYTAYILYTVMFTLFGRSLSKYRKG